jgi:hypothetical protein
MFAIDNNNDIRISKGETVSLNVPLTNPDKTQYTMTGNDTLVLSIKKSVDDNETVAQFTSNTNKIDIPHTGTNSLSTGLYKYDILLITGSGDYFYIVEPHIFEIVNVIGT